MNVPIGAFFPILYSILFFYLTIVFFISYKRSNDQISGYMSPMSLFIGFSFFLFGVPPILFPTESLSLTLTTNVMGYFVSYIAIAFYAMTLSPLLLPKVKPMYFFLVAFLLGTGISILDVLTLIPTTITDKGLIVRHIPSFVLLLNNTLLGLIFIPFSGSFIYQSIKKGLVAKGMFFGVGAALLSLFLPLSLQAQEVNTYFFFSIGATLGGMFIMLAVTVWGSQTIHISPIEKTNQTSQPNQPDRTP